MIRVFTDGACQPNPGEMGIGIVIEWQNKQPTILSKNMGYGTNNKAEYQALLQALVEIKARELKEVEINSDSNLMVNQVNQTWQCRDKDLQPLCELAIKRIEYLKERGYDIKLNYIRRELNLADAPAKRGCIKNV